MFFVYYRHEGGLIRRWRLGFEWWHGPNFFWRTNWTVYIAGFGFGVCRDRLTKDDFIELKMRLMKCSREEVLATPNVFKDW